jgi:hypothetical protein
MAGIACSTREDVLAEFYQPPHAKTASFGSTVLNPPAFNGFQSAANN